MKNRVSGTTRVIFLYCCLCIPTTQAEEQKGGVIVRSLGFCSIVKLSDASEECEACTGSAGDMINTLTVMSFRKKCPEADTAYAYFIAFGPNETGQITRTNRIAGKFNSGKSCLQKALSHPNIPKKFKGLLQKELE